MTKLFLQTTVILSLLGIAFTQSDMFIDISYAKNYRYAVVGPLMANLSIGSNSSKILVSLDTMNTETIIGKQSKLYNPDQSDTAKKVMDHQQKQLKRQFEFGAYQWKSEKVYSDQICLNSQDQQSMCSKDSEFLLSNNLNLAVTITGFDNEKGCLGLAPTGKSFIDQLQEQKVISNKILAFDYNEQGKSTMQIGGYDNNTHKDLVSFNNKGGDKWALDITNVKYDGMKMSSHSAKAFIDTGNSSIQLPEDVHDNILKQMQKLDDDYISFKEGFDHSSDKIIRVNVDCDEIIDKLPPIELELDSGDLLKINPRGYIYPSVPGDSFCKIGIAGVEGMKNEIRLGSIFMRNFYTALDYDNKVIILGPQSNFSSMQKTSGKSSDSSGDQDDNRDDKKQDKEDDEPQQNYESDQHPNDENPNHSTHPGHSKKQYKKKDDKPIQDKKNSFSQIIDFIMGFKMKFFNELNILANIFTDPIGTIKQLIHM